jgi:hypothetical protein
MPNTELLLKEAERLSPECFIELLDFARFLSQKPAQSSGSSIDELRAEQVQEWPDHWAESARAGSIELRLYSPKEFIEKRSFSAGQGLSHNG